jgi:hypothetical protein
VHQVELSKREVQKNCVYQKHKLGAQGIRAASVGFRSQYQIVELIIFDI